MIDLLKIAQATDLMLAQGETVFQAFRFAKTDAEHLLRLMHWAELPNKARLIDLGCGVGAVTQFWSTVRPDIETTLVNISPEQLAKVDHPRKHLCDMLQVPEPSESFDAAMSLFAIGHTDQEKALVEMARLVKPGGSVYVFDMIRTHGTNKKLAPLNYTVEPRQVMEKRAKIARLKLDFYLEPKDRGRYGERVIGPMFNVFFDGCKPAIWRWVK